MNSEELERQTTRLLQTLRQELDQRITDEQIITTGQAHYRQLSNQATITDYIPLLVYRQTKEQLTRPQSRPDPRRKAATAPTRRAPERRPGNPRRQRWPRRTAREPRRTARERWSEQ
jgi:hypothetical protein